MLVTFGLLVLVFIAFTYKPKLTKVHEAIVATHRNVSHIDASIFVKLETENTVLFDVRETTEFEVSHLFGAIHLNPNISAADFESAFGDLVFGKTVVFYCSVGKRSSALASRLQNLIVNSGASDVFNLVGGIFQWRNESRPLVQGQAIKTKKIHPYNKYWARYLSSKRAISYSPEKHNNLLH